MRRGLFRRPAPPAPGRVAVPTTAALARVARAAADIPGEVESSPDGCTAAHRVAHLLATVATDLVDYLLALEPAEQAAHPAYRQTLRLAAELEGVRDIITRRRAPPLIPAWASVPPSTGDAGPKTSRCPKCEPSFSGSPAPARTSAEAVSGAHRHATGARRSHELRDTAYPLPLGQVGGRETRSGAG